MGALRSGERPSLRALRDPFRLRARGDDRHDLERQGDRTEPRLDASVTVACALEVEERVARKAGLRTAVVGMGVTQPVPEGPLVSFGFAGGLVPELERGALLTATLIVSDTGEKLWEGKPIAVDGAKPAVICSTDRVIDSA